MLKYLTIKSLMITKYRLLGETLTSINAKYPEYSLNSNEFQMNYGDQRSSYYFDYGVINDSFEYGVEGSISDTEFMIIEYTNPNSNTFKINIQELPSKLGCDQFFQYSLIEDVGELTVEQLNLILEIRDIINNKKIDWGVE